MSINRNIKTSTVLVFSNGFKIDIKFEDFVIHANNTYSEEVKNETFDLFFGLRDGYSNLNFIKNSDFIRMSFYISGYAIENNLPVNQQDLDVIALFVQEICFFYDSFRARRTDYPRKSKSVLDIL